MPYSKSSKEETRIGLEVFFTDTPGIKGRIKKQPEDFIVTERSIDIEHISEAALTARDPKLPVYTYARVRSKNWESNRLIMKMAQQLGVPYNKISFAGAKDKRAITDQLMAFWAPMDDVKKLELNDVELYDLFLSTREFKIGDLVGNDFEINIHEIETSADEASEILAQTNKQLEVMNGFPNFFGVQRFGIIRPITHEMGRLILEKRFEEAVWLFIANPIKGEPVADFEARTEFEKCWDFNWAVKKYPKHLTFERILIKYLNSHPDDYLGAIGQLPRNLSVMFINAYQSLLFNKILSERIRCGLPLNEPLVGDIVLPVDDYKLPKHKTWIKVTPQNQNKLTKLCKLHKAFVSGVLFGCESILAEGEPGEIERNIIQAEGLNQELFIIPEFPILSSKGTRRELVGPVNDFKYEIVDDYIKTKFGLIKGAYATVLLREYMKGNIWNY